MYPLMSLKVSQGKTLQTAGSLTALVLLSVSVSSPSFSTSSKMYSHLKGAPVQRKPGGASDPVTPLPELCHVNFGFALLSVAVWSGSAEAGADARAGQIGMVSARTERASAQKPMRPKP